MAERPDLEWKRDEGKVRVELLPAGPLIELAEVFTYGANKYRAWSWMTLPAERQYASALRHLLAWRSGERDDPESGKTHLAHAATNIMMMMVLDERESSEEEIHHDG